MPATAFSPLSAFQALLNTTNDDRGTHYIACTQPNAHAIIMTPKPVPEASVLSPRDPSLTSSDDWPEYRLSDVTITLPGKPISEPTSLLVASEHYPVTVTGKLEAVSEELSHTYLLSKKQKRPYVEVPDVKSYAYGAYEDGSFEIWAAGGAGWFAIDPSPAALDVYNEMTEAVKLLFFIVDAYKTPRKTGKARNVATLPDYTAKELFEKYASEALDDDSEIQEAMELFHRHREFLISSMLTGKEGMAWSGNPLYKHLYKKFPGDFTRIRHRLAAPDKAVKKAPPTHTRQASVDSESTTSSLKRKRGRPPRSAAPDVISIDSSSVISSTARTTQAEDSRSKAAKAKTKSAPRPTRQNGGSVKSSAPASGAETPEIPESQPEAHTQDSDTDSIPHRRKRKSALRLKPNKPSKGPPRSSNLPLEEEDDEPEPRSSPVPNGKRKRDEANGTIKHSKRRSSRYEVDEGIDIPASPSSEEVAGSPDAELGATDTTLPLRLNHRPDPVQEDTWICALDGCTHKVYAASVPESQKLIREHYALHAYDDDERVRLVKRLEAPSMPVSHLMEKVRIQARLEGFPGSRVAGTRFPEPLKTRY